MANHCSKNHASKNGVGNFNFKNIEDLFYMFSLIKYKKDPRKYLAAVKRKSEKTFKHEFFQVFVSQVLKLQK